MRRRERPSPSVASALVRAARARKGLTQAQFAAKAAVSQQTISRIERGESDPGIRQLNSLLRPIGLELRVQLVGYEEPHLPRVEIDLREREAMAAQAEAELRLRAV